MNAICVSIAKEVHKPLDNPRFIACYESPAPSYHGFLIPRERALAAKPPAFQAHTRTLSSRIGTCKGAKESKPGHSKANPAKTTRDGDVEEKAKKQARQSFEQIHEASARPKNVKDIRDELNMLKAVPKQQNTVQNELHDITTETAK
ncbi:hypothetical protein IFR04_007673 [Cadophora malorum]|uniref:Uncharacterized protein n=1 Tax=Cadophora malorum TaxID=108018 RepID=A0A8H7W8F7_9HELO|nr:hypothetical protein IFR04_007673 [Cadophora malorum]